jgi:molybdate transport system substrate-binding protein
MSMQRTFGAAVLGAGLVLLLTCVHVAAAAEIKVLSSVGVKAVTDEMIPQFEKTTGNKVVITFDVAAKLKKKIEDGESFDLAILTAPIIDDLIKSGKIAPASRTDIARSGVGIAVRKGAPKPDISTPEALKRTLLNAKSVAYAEAGASGTYFMSLLQKFGIADEMKAKNQLVTNPSPIEAAAKGEAELGVRLISEILAVPEADLVGPLPGDLQNYTVLTAGTGAAAKEPAAARALVDFLTGSAVLPSMKAKGLEPGSAPGH